MTQAPPTPAGGTTSDALSRPGRRSWVILLVVAIIGLGVDLGTKYWAFRSIADRPVTITREQVLAQTAIDPGSLMNLIPPHRPIGPHGIFQFHLVLNNGAVFGAGQGKRWMFIGFTIAVLGIALYSFGRWGERRSIATPLAVGLVVAGGLGNLYDRVVYACVRDFLHPLAGVRLPFGLRWPHGSPDLWPYVSNVADAFLLVGIFILVVKMWRADNAKTRAGLRPEA